MRVVDEQDGRSRWKAENGSAAGGPFETHRQAVELLLGSRPAKPTAKKPAARTGARAEPRADAKDLEAAIAAKAEREGTESPGKGQDGSGQKPGETALAPAGEQPEELTGALKQSTAAKPKAPRGGGAANAWRHTKAA